MAKSLKAESITVQGYGTTLNERCTQDSSEGRERFR